MLGLSPFVRGLKTEARIAATDGDPAYTLVQVAVNDLIMLFAFAPIVMMLCGVANVVVPPKVLITSVVVFIVIPLAAGWLTRALLLKPTTKTGLHKFSCRDFSL